VNSTDVSNKFSPRAFRNVMSNYPTGVAVVTGKAEDGEVMALVVGTFSSVSIDPPLVSFMPMKTSRTFERMRRCESLCINIFGGEQEDAMMKIAKRRENKLDGIEWYPSPSGDPILNKCIGWIDTSISEIVEAGDHWIVLCHVHDLEVTNPVPPLLFFQGGYGSFVGTAQLGRLRHDTLPATHAAHGAHDSLTALAQSIGCEVIVYTALSEDELATVYSAVGEGVKEQDSFSSRVPIVPPIGDTYVFDKDSGVQERWLGKLDDSSDTVRTEHQRRLEFLKDKGYIISHLPADGQQAYGDMIAATREYLKAPLTPLSERAIRDLIEATTVDYLQREITEDETFTIGSIVLPVQDPTGDYTLTLRLSQLPQNVDGATVNAWIDQAKLAVARIEDNRTPPMSA
jgi:flavin reductase (DIM6/NTAB) family NADH-FMN oxidoreductase RutF